MNDKVFRWLEKVLAERFGNVWSLSKCGAGIELRLKDADGFILFDNECDGFTEVGLSELPCSYWDAKNEGWETVLGKALPVPGLNFIPLPLIEKGNRCHIIHFDIIGLTYWMLARIEEIGRTDLDAHQRLLSTSSHAFKKGYLERPIVDEWLHILGQVIQRQWPSLELKKHLFDMKVSHDVDNPSCFGFLNFNQLIRNMGHYAIKKRDFNSALRASWVRINTKKQLHNADPYNTFDWIMDLSNQQGFTSAFYFICGNTDPHDADYRIEHPAIRSLMWKIHQRGHEIGLHPSYGSYNKPQIISSEANHLFQVCAQEGIKQRGWGARMHYLRWQHPATLRALAEAGINYDSSLGFADYAGFRCGTCFEYPGFDPVEQVSLPIRIRPLIAMETTIMSDRYMGLGTGVEALKKFINLKNACRSLGGTFTLLWHNSAIKGNEDIYQKILTL